MDYRAKVELNDHFTIPTIVVYVTHTKQIKPYQHTPVNFLSTSIFSSLTNIVQRITSNHVVLTLRTRSHSLSSLSKHVVTKLHVLGIGEVYQCMVVAEYTRLFTN